MQKLITLLVTSLCALSVSAATTALDVKGKWITEGVNTPMENPQPSGLVYRQGELLFIADRSADPRQRQKIHRMNPATGALIEPAFALEFAPSLASHCFYEYVHSNPDYESLVIDVDNPNVMYIITEDASYMQYRPECLEQWQPTGSAQIPFLLLRGELKDGRLQITHIRPIQFAASMQIGEFANDGIEGMAMAPDRTLYLALEKDLTSNPRIFSLHLGKDFWQQSGFAQVSEPALQFPKPGDRQHPLNAMQYIAAEKPGHPGYLAAFARNVDELWMVDLSGKQPAKVIPMDFWAPTDGKNCPAYELMNNASIEGLALNGHTLYLVNDPWKEHYKENIQCESNRGAYESYAPLLFEVDLHLDWFENSK